MRTVGTTVALSGSAKSGIRWKRVVIAAFLSELAVMAVLGAIIVPYMFLIAPGQTSAAYDEFGQNAGYYAAAPAAALATFFIAYLAVRKLDSAVIANGVMVGVVEVLLTLGFIFGARPGDRPMYVVSFVLRIAAGYAAGALAQRKRQRGLT